MANKRIGIFGGRRGMAFYSVIAKTEGFTLCAICDEQPQMREAVKKAVGEDVQICSQGEIIGFARYLAAQVSGKDEASNAIALEKLGILLSSACDAFMMLIGNTVQDTIQLDGKPSFSVKKEK